MMVNGTASPDSIGASARLSRVYKCDRSDLREEKPEARSLLPAISCAPWVSLAPACVGDCAGILGARTAVQHVAERHGREQHTSSIAGALVGCTKVSYISLIV